MAGIDDATDADKILFINLLKAEFPGEEETAQTLADLKAQMCTISQKDDECIRVYYTRVDRFHKALSGKDLPQELALTPLASVNLIILDSMRLSGVVGGFVNGLCNLKLRIKVISRYLQRPVSLHNVCTAAERIWASMQAKQQLQKEMVQQDLQLTNDLVGLL